MVDMFANMLPAILPAIRSHFMLRLSLGSVVLASLMLTANGVQLLTGHMRADKSKPLFLPVGLLLAAGICLLALAPQSSWGVALIIGLGIVSGCGIAVVHPEGLRAVHALDAISPAMSTAVFMTGGFLGFASGGAISTQLVTAGGLAGLYPLLLCPLAGVMALGLSRVRLSGGDSEADAARSAAAASSDQLPFWYVLAMGLPAAIATTIVLSLVPTYLHDELGFELTFGGLASFMFGAGGTVGPFLWAAAASRKGDLPCALLAFLLSVPCTVLYLLFSEHRFAIWLLFGAGFCAMSAYILTITLSRYARGLNFGHRMAFIVGGNWGIASLVFMAVSPLAERFGTGAVLKFMPAGYAISALLALWMVVKYPQASRRVRASVAETVADEHPSV
jgi:FSR family fosmidomycin resistance protein-like MFS transporter